jgi:hypothetical protein
MDIKGVRTLNLVGTIFFALFGIGMPLYYISISFFFFYAMPYDSDFIIICYTAIVGWIVFIMFLTYMLYNKTVLGLDRHEYEDAKKWMLVGAILGFFFAGNVLTLIIFLVSIVSIDDALRPRYYYPPPGYYPYPPGYPQDQYYPPPQEYPQNQYYPPQQQPYYPQQQPIQPQPSRPKKKTVMKLKNEKK